MAWKQLAPLASVRGGKTQVSITVTQRKGADHTVARINLAETFLSEFGADVQAVMVFEGEDDTAGKMMVTIATAEDIKNGGTMKVSRTGKHGAWYVKLPQFSAQPDFAVDLIPCIVTGKTTNSFVFTLPLEDWNERRVAIENARRKANTRLPEKPMDAPIIKPSSVVADGDRAPKVAGIEPINVVDYLVKKGHRVAKLAGPHFQLDGERVTIDDLVLLVNKYRTKGGLGTITKLQLVH